MEEEATPSACSPISSPSVEKQLAAVSLGEPPVICVQCSRKERECSHCTWKIEKESLMFTILYKETMENKIICIDCFPTVLYESNVTYNKTAREVIKGLNLLAEKNETLVNAAFRVYQQSVPAVEKTDHLVTGDLTEWEIHNYKNLQEQGKIYSLYQSRLQNLDRKQLIEILVSNIGEPHYFDDLTLKRLLDAIADCLCFGIPIRCRRCQGPIIYSEQLDAYCCTGYTLNYLRCSHFAHAVPRRNFYIPDDIIEEYPELDGLLPKRSYLPGHVEATNQKVEQLRAKSKSYESFFMRTSFIDLAATKGKKVVKDRVSMEAFAPNVREFHVYLDAEGIAFSATMVNVDITINRNSYVKMQIWKHDSFDIFAYYYKEGRIGCKLGEETALFEEEPCGLVARFLKKFKKLTGYNWDNHVIFKKLPGKYLMVEDGSYLIATKLYDTRCYINQDVVDLIAAVTNTYELRLNARLYPLEYLTMRHVKKGYAVLLRIQELFYNGDRNEVIALSNEFYSLIPHCFGRKPGLIIDNELTIIKEHIRLIRMFLNNIKFYYAPGMGDKIAVNDPLADCIIRQLGCSISLVDPESDFYYVTIREFERSSRLMIHSEIVVDNIFKVVRKGEKENFNNEISRTQLFHGCPINQVFEKLQHGLDRISDEQAIFEGRPFGGGIHFTDSAHVAAKFCKIGYGGCGFIFLCDVAVGNVLMLNKKPNEYSPDLIFNTKRGKVPYEPTEDRWPLPGTNEDTSDEEHFLVLNKNQVMIDYLIQFRWVRKRDVNNHSFF